MLILTLLMLYFMLNFTLFYYRTLIFVQFFLFLVMILNFFQYWSCNFPISACPTLPQSKGKVKDAATRDIIPLTWKQ